MPHLRIDGMIRFDPCTTAEWLRKYSIIQSAIDRNYLLNGGAKLFPQRRPKPFQLPSHPGIVPLQKSRSR